MRIQPRGPRANQQDTLKVFKGRAGFDGMVIVADGHGELGECSGALSDWFAEILAEHLLDFQGDDDALVEACTRAVAATDKKLCNYLDAAASKILENVQTDPVIQLLVNHRGEDYFLRRLSSGSTLLALVSFEGRLLVIHVGDCCLCHVPTKEEEIVRLTVDHSWEEDEITETIGTVVYKHDLAVARAMGHPILKREKKLPSHPDVLIIDSAKPGDVFVLCSDGVKLFAERSGENYPPQNLLHEAPQHSVRDIMRRSAREAEDNFSLAIVRIPPEATAEYPTPLKTAEYSVDINSLLSPPTREELAQDPELLRSVGLGAVKSAHNANTAVTTEIPTKKEDY